MRNMTRIAWTLAMAFSAASAAAAQDEAQGVVRKFLQAHCTECHGAEVQKRNLRLDTLPREFAKPELFAGWVKVHDKIESGEMPPPKRDRPSKEEVASVLKALRKDLEKADLARRATEGRAVYRRLNRVEYENTLRDLLALPNLSVKELLPEDGRAFGFTKVGGALDLSHVQLAKYMEAADVALDAAIATYPEKPAFFKRRYFPGDQYDFKITLLQGDTLFLKDQKYDEGTIPLIRDKWQLDKLSAYEKSGLFPYEGTAGVFRSSDEGFQGRFDRFSPVYPGYYRLRLSVWSYAWDKGKVLPSLAPQASTLMVGSRLLGYFDAPSLEPKVHETVAWLNPGDQLKWNPVSLPWVRVSERPGKAAEWVGPGVALDWMEVEGPIVESWPPEGHKRLFGELPIERIPDKTEVRSPRRAPLRHSAPFPPKPALDKPDRWTVASANPAADARLLLGKFMKRAFRRPVPSGELERYMKLVRERLNAKVSLEESLRAAYKAVLCSPDFIFLQEKPGSLDSPALAARLSYFLWNSTPDDALLAAAGKLGDPEGLRAQTERLLNDPRSERFIEDFLDQWLGLRDLDATTPDAKLYSDFDPYLRDSMPMETRAFFRELLQKDLGVLQIVDSDWSMINQRLAEHYGLPEVQGSAVRKTALPAGSHRGGLLTQASVLKVTANGTTTSPVTRGVWLLDRILARPPQPPPPDLPTIDPDVRGATTIREQLDKHRSQPTCATCHVKIDPPGFALESYDVIGGWRTQYRSVGAGGAPPKSSRPASYRLAKPVDPSGQLPDGRAFKDIDEFKRLLLADPDAIARGFVEQLVVYSTGAGLQFSDRSRVDEIVARARSKGYGVRTLIHEVVQSELFRTK
jgi:mono/diheme cytochrome c family protein